MDCGTYTPLHVSKMGLHTISLDLRNFQYSEKIILWNPDTKEKAIVTPEEFKNEAELDETIEARLPVAEIFQAGYIELCGVVYCLASRGLPVKFL